MLVFVGSPLRLNPIMAFWYIYSACKELVLPEMLTESLYTARRPRPKILPGSLDKLELGRAGGLGLDLR